MNGAFGTFSLADIAAQAQDAKLRSMQIEDYQARRERQAQSDETAQHREQATMIAKLTDGVTDDATYQQRRQAAIAYGMDPGAIPETYDPQFVQTYNTLAHTLLRPDGEQKLSTAAQQAQELTGLPITDPRTRQVMSRLLSDNVPVQAGGAVYTNDPLNGFAPGIVPNPGNAPAGASAQGGIQDGATATNPQTGERIIFRNGQWQPMGGTAGNGGGNFPPGQ